jgi:chromosomal replication initiator protein
MPLNWSKSAMTNLTNNSDTLVQGNARPGNSTERIGREVARQVGSRKWDMWFDRTTDFVVEDGRLRVEADSRFVADWIERHFREAIQIAARAELGNDIKVQMGVRSHPGAPAAESVEAAPPPAPDRSSARRGRRTGTRDRRDAEPKLDHFEIGDSNRLAFDAASRLGEDLDGATSVLFIHGDCGIGKTHLLRGICARRKQRDRRAKVRYLTGEQFTNEYIQAVRSSDLDNFRRTLRRLDLLAIDDVHFLSNKNATQSEFLHTIDAIAMSGGAVAVVCDDHPRTINRFSGPLVSRFLSGMVVRVDRPDRELRVRLVKRLACDRGIRLGESAMETLASRCVGSVRELLGGLTRIDALARLDSNAGEQGEIGSIAVQRALGDESMSTGGKPIRLSRILEVVCKEVGVDRDELLSSGRHRRVVLARGLCAYLARELTNACFPEIASALGRTTHSTVHTADRRIRRQLEADERVSGHAEEVIRLRDLVDEIRQSLRRG